MKLSRLLLVAAPFAALLTIVTSSGGCQGPIENRDPVGETFVSVEGLSLTGEERRLPEDLAGSPAVLLVGYVQEAQFDLDRWLLGLAQVESPVAIYEVPTIEGLVPGLLSGTIDDGMRSGIPQEDWPTVITVYDDAGRIIDQTGQENPRNGRVMLLDGTGTIVWFHDRGYSASKMLELDGRARALLDEVGRR